MANDETKNAAVEETDDLDQEQEDPTSKDSGDQEGGSEISQGIEADLKKWNEEKEELEEERDKLRREMARLKKYEEGMNEKIATLEKQIESKTPTTTDMEDRLEYIKRQREIREERYSNFDKLRKAGFTDNVLRSPASPLDQAFEKSKPGTAGRPKVTPSVR